MSTIPLGFKQTELGVIPENWDVAPLCAITTDIGDGLHGTPVYSSNGGCFFINGNNLRNGKIVFSSETKTVDHLEFTKNKKNLSDRTILMSINGTIGNLGLFDGEPVVLGKSAAYLNVKQGVSKKFVYHSLQTEVVRRQFFDGLTGSTIGNLGLTTIRNAHIPLPPTNPEQEAIAEALSDADSLIESLEQLLAKKRHLKQGTMQELLTGKKRLPGFSGEWEVKRLSDMATLSKAGLNPASTPDTLFTHFSLPAFDDGVMPVTEFGSLIGSNKFSVPSDAVLLSKLNPRIPRVWAPLEIPDNSVCSTEFLVLIPRECTSRVFLAALCRSPIVCYQMELHAIGTTGSHQRIHPAQALAIVVIVPTDKAEQAAIAETLSDMDTEIAALEIQHAKTRSLKQGMMHKLLTGEIRLV